MPVSIEAASRRHRRIGERPCPESTDSRSGAGQHPPMPRVPASRRPPERLRRHQSEPPPRPRCPLARPVPGFVQPVVVAQPLTARATRTLTCGCAKRLLVGVGACLSARPSLRTVRAVFPHTALQERYVFAAKAMSHRLHHHRRPDRIRTLPEVQFFAPLPRLRCLSRPHCGQLHLVLGCGPSALRALLAPSSTCDVTFPGSFGPGTIPLGSMPSPVHVPGTGRRGCSVRRLLRCSDPLTPHATRALFPISRVSCSGGPPVRLPRHPWVDSLRLRGYVRSPLITCQSFGPSRPVNTSWTHSRVSHPHPFTRGSRAFVAPGFVFFAETRLPIPPPPGSFSCGLVFRLRALRTPPRGDALPLGYRTPVGLVHEDFHLLPDRLSGVHQARLRGLPPRAARVWLPNARHFAAIAAWTCVATSARIGLRSHAPRRA
jgi:hypothetical protein